jgi:CRP/FNR family transcriptional regulator, dissimilatory nitrate respiration regulator
MDLRVFNIPRYLSVQPLFTDLSAAELERLAQGCALRRFGRGETVFLVGEPCEEFHVCVTGQVKLYAVSSSGAEKVIDIIAPGQSFAEALMFTGRPYIINAQTLTDALLLSVKKQAVEDEIARDARFALRLHGLVHDVEAYALHSGVQRVIGYLLRDIATEEGGVNALPVTVSLPVSKATIASRLSLTPEYFSRVLHELEAAGLVRIDKRDIHILDASALANYRSP